MRAEHLGFQPAPESNYARLPGLFRFFPKEMRA